MKTIENNILIAEFMEFKWELRDHYGINIMQNPQNGKGYGLGALKFNLSWDWLMPVVEQIKNIGTHSETSDGEYTLLDKIDDALIFVRIDLVYEAVIEFIKWHNKNLDIL